MVHTNPANFPKQANAGGLRMVDVGPDKTIVICDQPLPNASAMVSQSASQSVRPAALLL